jgi:putative spermidine/putrescine transport system substrate-binding protein
MNYKRVNMLLGAAVLTVIFLGISAPAVVGAQETLTITSYGGAYQEAQRKAYFEPFAKKFGVKIIEDEWSGDMAKLRAMVQSGNITWDALAISEGQLELAGDEGLIIPLDVKLFGGANKFIPGAVTECGIGTLVSGLVIGYDARKFQGNEPTKLTDFWDVKKFPGARALKKWPKHNMEWALLADGVPKSDIYKLLATEEGFARALKKLDQIKPHIKVWFDNWAQPGQLMSDGEVAMSSGTNGRLAVAQKSNPSIKFMTDGMGLGGDSWSVVKGSKKKDLAIKFIQFASAPENQLEFSKLILYGPTNIDTFKLMDPALAAQMPSNPKYASITWKIDSRWWSDHNDDLSVRFNAWLAK